MEEDKQISKLYDKNGFAMNLDRLAEIKKDVYRRRHLEHDVTAF